MYPTYAGNKSGVFVRVSTIIYLLLALLFTGISHARAELTVTLKYKINVNSMYKGDLFLTVYPTSFKSTYMNIEKNDRIPFYCAAKSGEFVNDLYSTRLIYNHHNYSIYYDFKKLPSDIYTHQAYQKANKAFIVDQKEKKISYAVDRIPVMAFENIIIGFIRKKLVSAINDMILFEDETKTLFRIYFEKTNKKQKRRIYSGTCAYHTFNCFRKNIGQQSSKKLFILEVSNQNIPIRIASVSGRWEIIIEEYIEGEITPVDVHKYLVRSVTDSWLKHYNITSSQLRTPMRVNVFQIKGNKLIYDYEIQVEINNDISHQVKYAAQYFQRVLFDNLYAVKDRYIKKNGLYFQVNVSDQEILNQTGHFDISSLSSGEYQMHGENIMAFKLLGPVKSLNYSKLSKMMKKVSNGYILRVSHDDVFKHLYKDKYNRVSYKNNIYTITGRSYSSVDTIEKQIQIDLKYQLNTKKLFMRDRMWFIASKAKPLPVCR
jgi:hypothetical protein